jgi:hypothetical protein
VVELNSAQVTEQRRVMGRRRVKSDVLDLEAMTELLLAGVGVRVDHGVSVLGELTAWAGHRHRRVVTRTATKNQLLGQLDRCFPVGTTRSTEKRTPARPMARSRSSTASDRVRGPRDDVDG